MVIGELTLPGYSFINVPRANGKQGGGSGVLFKSHLKLRLIGERAFNSQSFEYAIISNISHTINYVTVRINNINSEVEDLKFGVPQGSVIGPQCFTMYIRPIQDILNNHGFQ